MSFRNSNRPRRTEAAEVRGARLTAQLLALLLLAGFVAPAYAQTARSRQLSDEEIFEKAFKKKPVSNKPVQIPIPIFYENNTDPITQVQGQIGSIPEELLLEADPVMRAIESVVEAPLVYRPLEIQGAELVEKEAARNWVPLASFRDLPYKVVYDEKKLEIRIFVPPEARKKGVLSVMQKSSYEPPGVRMEPAKFSSYLNIQGSESLQYGTSSLFGNLDSRQPIRVALQHGANFKGFVLESNIDYMEPAQNSTVPTWRRGDVKLMKDYPSLLLRQTIGDISYPVRGFQSYRALGGVNVMSQFGMDASKLSIATGRYEIFLKRPSKVEIWINDQLKQTFDLPAGPHDLRNFPFVDGANDLRIDITDDLGQKESVQHSYFSSSELLNPGLNEVSYSFGAPWIDQGSGRTYDTSRLASSIYHRRGVSDSLTLGLNFQSEPGSLLLGGEAVFPVFSGLINIEPAISRTDSFGFAVRTRYANIDPQAKMRSKRSFTLGLESKSPYFAHTSSSIYAMNPVVHNLSGNMTWSLTENTNGNLGLNYQIIRKSYQFPSDTWSLSVGMSRQWKDGPTGSISIREQKRSDEKMEVSLVLGLSMSFRKERQRIAANYNLRDDATRIDWSYASPNSGPGSLRARAGVLRNLTSRGFESSVDYTANRGVLALSHYSRKHELSEEQGGPYSMTQFTLQGGTALVFADGQFAISRPVWDSFAIVAPEKNLAGEVIQLNPQRKTQTKKQLELNAAEEDTFVAETGPLGAAAVTEIPSYTLYSLRIAPKKPNLAGIEHDMFSLRPSYRSGFLIRLGTDLSLYLSGKFLFEDGSPVGLQPGKIRSLSDDSWPQVTFFTSKSGKTRVEGFKAGKYVLEFLEAGLAPVEFTIPETSPEVFDLGQVVIRRKQ